MAVHMVNAVIVVCLLFTKNNHACFGEMEWTGLENWTVKCTALMGLLAKNTVITGINLQRQKARKSIDNYEFDKVLHRKGNWG